MIFVEAIVRSSPLGQGLFLAQDVEKDENIVKFEGEIISWIEAEKLNREGENQYINLHTPMPESYVNHSCKPSTGFIDSTTLIAMRDLHSGDEITFDYSLVTIDDWVMKCACNSSCCRKTISNYSELSFSVKNECKRYTPKWVLEYAEKSSS